MLEAPAYPGVFSPGREASTRKAPVVLAVACSLVVAAALFFGGKAQYLRLALPLATAAVALALYIYRPIAYIQFTLWVWFLAPLVRRLIDFRFGFAEPNFVLLCPLAAAGVAALTILRTERKTYNKLPATFIFCMVAIAYGFAVGMLVHPSAETVYGLVNWFCPLAFGLHLYLSWPAYQQHRDAIRKAFLLGILVMGVYGLYQYAVAPDWDTYWLTSLSSPYDIAPSFGAAAPFLIRVWSTLNAPGPFADVMMVGLLLILGMKSKWKVLAAILGYLTLLLSSVRTAWLGWLVGFGIILGNTKPKVLIRVLLSAVVLVTCLVVLAKTVNFLPQLTERLDTFTDLQSDASVGDRTAMYRALTAEAFGNPFGRGLSNSTEFRGYMIDSGFLLIAFSFGWFGTIAFAVGIAAFLARFAKRYAPATPDEFQLTCRAICLALLVQLVGGNVFTGVLGFLFWMCAGMVFAGQSFDANRSAARNPAGTTGSPATLSPSTLVETVS